ncbi:MAG: hypothetical protein QOD09_4863, partial [Bradyrhizobium sp.]|nr:hypothetical protein [Bradyrhizobium sp.]
MEGQAAAGLRLKKPQESVTKRQAWTGGRRSPHIVYNPGECVLSESDPTDHALAAIASILDKPESLSFPDVSADAEAPAKQPPREPAAPVEADGYSKIGPGPLQAIRFKWTVRRDDKGDYYVDETIGDNSVPISSGPMPEDAAIRFVDERESEARRRFEGIKREMAGRDVTG